MADWYCFQDKVKLEEADVVLNYVMLNEYFTGLKCPQCGVQYLPEEVVLTEVAEKERQLESK